MTEASSASSVFRDDPFAGSAEEHYRRLVDRSGTSLHNISLSALHSNLNAGMWVRNGNCFILVMSNIIRTETQQVKKNVHRFYSLLI